MEKGKLKRHRIKFLFGMVAVCFLITNCASVSDHNYFDKTLGLNIALGKKIFDSSDAINPQGEGFSIESYHFKLKAGKYVFKDKFSYPKPHEWRVGWKISQWENAPLKNEDIQALLFKYLIEDSAMKAQLGKIKNALNSTNNYLSYYYKDNDGEIYAVDICVVDIENKIVYLCEVIS